MAENGAISVPGHPAPESNHHPDPPPSPSRGTTPRPGMPRQNCVINMQIMRRSVARRPRERGAAFDRGTIEADDMMCYFGGGGKGAGMAPSWRKSAQPAGGVSSSLPRLSWRNRTIGETKDLSD